MMLSMKVICSWVSIEGDSFSVKYVSLEMSPNHGLVSKNDVKCEGHI